MVRVEGVLMRCNLPGRYVCQGPVTGVGYAWNEGEVINVLPDDVPGLLAKTREMAGCCGRKPERRTVFSLV